MKRALVVCALSSLILGCGDDESTSPPDDAGHPGDAAGGEVAPDGQGGPPDAIVGDVGGPGPDVVEPDPADAAPDAVPDVDPVEDSSEAADVADGQPDVLPDAAPDAIADVDETPPDVAVDADADPAPADADAGPADVAPDVAEDTGGGGCQPVCDGKECGGDGCGGSCGECEEGGCSVVGVCETGGCWGQCGGGGSGGDSCWCDDVCFGFGDCCENVCAACFEDYVDQCCAPSCEGKKCGDDGCGGSCGGCEAGTKCGDAFECVACEPDCDGKGCGDDDCNGSCGSCEQEGFTCQDFTCKLCHTQCAYVECGDDGCGGSCGGCPEGLECAGGKCEDPSSCVGKCGGIASGCFCSADCSLFGDCCDDFCDECGEDYPSGCCEPQCEGLECGDDGCGSVCGICMPGTKCDEAGLCHACEPACQAKDCGDDQCNGSCGDCGENEICNDDQQCEPCFPVCDGTTCGPDGCGGFCDCPVDCADLDPGPFVPYLVPGAIASEGLAFDTLGNLAGGNIGSVFLSEYQQPAKIFVPGLKQRAGMQFIPGGDLIVNDDLTGTIWRVDPTGQKWPIVTGLVYPNGIDVDHEGLVYVTEDTLDLVFQINPDGLNDYVILADGKFGHPNGITFDNTFTRLYLAGCPGDGRIWTMDKNPDGTFGEPEPWSQQLGACLDGLEVDLCGNVYVGDYAAGGMLRISPDAQEMELVVPQQFYIPNMQWGSGIGGWDPLHWFVPNGSTFEVYEIDIGVPGKDLPWP